LGARRREDLLLDEELRSRAGRLMRGDFRTEDVDRLFLGQRARARNRACFREIGDFVAHRDVREKGLITQVGRDIFTSVDVWSLKLRDRDPSRADISRAAHANLCLASDEQLESGCGCRRVIARKRLESALGKVDRNERPTDLEFRVLEYLGFHFIWRPAFTSDQLFAEFKEVLTLNGIIRKADGSALNDAKTFLSLYALALMHGSSIVLDDGQRARLFSGFANRERRLEVKVKIVFNELAKPVMTPVCLFLTDLRPEEHCDPDLLTPSNPVLMDHWAAPIEIGASGRLTQIS
jgi:hypothetical protein